MVSGVCQLEGYFLTNFYENDSTQRQSKVISKLTAVTDDR
jgi:hypothetical protein